MSLLCHRCSSSGFGFLRFEKFRVFHTRMVGFRLGPSATIHHLYCLQKANCLQFTIFPQKCQHSRVRFLHAKIVSFSARSNWEYFCDNWHYHLGLCSRKGLKMYTLALNKSRNDQNSIHPKANIDLESHDED